LRTEKRTIGFEAAASMGSAMELEFHQLELRYERLRMKRPAREKRLLASLAEMGQQIPILVVKEPEPVRYVVIDGYQRVRSLRRLARDTVRAMPLELEESEALVLNRHLRAREGETALEQAWLLDELQNRFGLSQERLAQRFDRSVSWVSRTLALVRELPDSVQDEVRSGKLVAHAAVKYLVPLARANRAGCERLVGGIAGARLTSREVGLLYGTWRAGTVKTRERLMAEPLMLLKALKETQASRTPEERSPADRLLGDLDLIGQAARRADRQLREGAAAKLLVEEREEMKRAFEESRAQVLRLERRMGKEMADAGPQPTDCDPGTPPQGCSHQGHRPGDEGVTAGGEEGPAVGLGDGAAVEPP
jgi:ParB/RepB/Spo0J family partition protein